MQVTVETTEGLGRRVRVEVPEERVRGEVDKRLSDMARTVRIPGFRPGKAPMRVLAQRYGKQVRDEVVGEIVQQSFYDAIAQEKLQPAGAPTIDPVEAGPGAGVRYTATFDVYPELVLSPLEQMSVARPRAAVAEPDVDRMLETLRRQRRTWNEVDRPATPQDRVVVDFEGSVGGAPLEGGRGAEVPVELDAGRMIPGFEDGLVGIGGGEERTLELAFPDPYHQAELAGKAVSFQVRAHRVEEAVLPEVDDEFARGFGVADGGMEGLRREVRGNMERELDDALRTVTKQRVLDALAEYQPVEVPRIIVQQEAARMLQERRGELERMGLDPEQGFAEATAGLESQARKRVALGLILAELIKVHDLKVDPQRVRGRIETIASTFEDADEVIRWYYSDNDRLGEVESSVLEDQVVEWVLERARVSDEEATFDELLRPGQTTTPSQGS